MKIRLVPGIGLAAIGLTIVAGTSMAQTPLLPPNAKPGECYTRVWVPPQYTTSNENITIKQSSKEFTVVPAKYEMVDEKILIKEASVKYVNVPAEYETITEKVMVKPARKEMKVVPAKYEKKTERVLDTPEHTIWKTGNGPIERLSESTGEIMCLVTVPAKYKDVETRKVVTAARVEEATIPAEYTNVSRQKIKTPATTKKIEIPAKYKTVRVRKMVTPPQVKETAIPAKTKEVTKRTLVSDGKMDWRTILCETNTSAGVVTKIQRALSKAGYNPGAIDGVMGGGTRVALREFQKAKGLAVGGLTMETMRALGVNI